MARHRKRSGTASAGVGLALLGAVALLGGSFGGGTSPPIPTPPTPGTKFSPGDRIRRVVQNNQVPTSEYNQIDRVWVANTSPAYSGRGFTDSSFTTLANSWSQLCSNVDPYFIKFGQSSLAAEFEI